MKKNFAFFFKKNIKKVFLLNNYVYFYIIKLLINQKTKTMNALENIKKQAEIIVEDLANREIFRMEDNFAKFDKWLAIEGNAALDRYTNKICRYASIDKYIYLTQCYKWDSELNRFVLPTEYTGSFEEIKKLRDITIQSLVRELKTMLKDNWKYTYSEQFIDANMFKLNRALAKHLTNDMTASDIKISVGGDGAEVTAIVDNKFFKTMGILCGGDIQCLHYRYRSSLK